MAKYVENLWELTWEECLAEYENGQALITIQGYILASRDRKLDPKAGYGMYRGDLVLAWEKNKPVPDRVWESEPDLYARLTGKGCQAETQPGKGDIESLIEEDPFAGHFNWLSA